MSGGRYSRPHGRGYGLHDSLITKEIVRQACPCVSNHVPDTNFPLKNLDGPSQGVRESNPLDSNEWFPFPFQTSSIPRLTLALQSFDLSLITAYPRLAQTLKVALTSAWLIQTG